MEGRKKLQELTFSELLGAYVIFICDFDPFGMEKYCYTFETRCCEDNQLILQEQNP